MDHFASLSTEQGIIARFRAWSTRNAVLLFIISLTPNWVTEKVKNSLTAQPADVLLAWARKITYSYVLPILDFSSSWIDGRVFCAILIQSGSLHDYDWAEICAMSVEARLRIAFETAELRLNVPPILDVDDLLIEPDSKSIQLYVSYLYKAIGSEVVDMRTAVDAIQAVVRLRDRAARQKNMEKLTEITSLIQASIEDFYELEQKIEKTTLDQAKKDRALVEEKKAQVAKFKLVVNDFQRNYKNESIEQVVTVFEKLRNLDNYLQILG